MSKLGHGAIATYSKNLLRSSSDILLDWIKSTQLVQIVGDEVVSAKKAREMEGDITPKEKIKKLTKNQIESFVKNYEDETGINLPEDLKKSFRNTIKSIKTGDLNIKDEAYDEFYEDDDIRALFKELDIAYESHNYFKGGNKLMKLYELKNENLKKLRIRANGESMEVQGPIPEVNNEIIEIKDDIIALDNEAASNEDIDSTYTMNVDNTVNDLKGRIFDLMDKTSGVKELAVSYKDAFADSLIALLSVKSNFDLNVADRPAEEVLNNTETLAAEITEKTNNDDKINDRVEEVKEVTSTDADSLIFNPVIDATAQEVTGEEPVPAAEEVESFDDLEEDDLEDVILFPRTVDRLTKVINEDREEPVPAAEGFKDWLKKKLNIRDDVNVSYNISTGVIRKVVKDLADTPEGRVEQLSKIYADLANDIHKRNKGGKALISLATALYAVGTGISAIMSIKQLTSKDVPTVKQDPWNVAYAVMGGLVTIGLVQIGKINNEISDEADINITNATLGFTGISSDYIGSLKKLRESMMNVGKEINKGIITLNKEDVLEEYDYIMLDVLDKGLNRIKSDIELLDKDIAAIEAKLAKEKNPTAQGEDFKDWIKKKLNIRDDVEVSRNISSALITKAVKKIGNTPEERVEQLSKIYADLADDIHKKNANMKKITVLSTALYGIAAGISAAMSIGMLTSKDADTAALGAGTAAYAVMGGIMTFGLVKMGQINGDISDTADIAVTNATLGFTGMDSDYIGKLKKLRESMMNVGKEINKGIITLNKEGVLEEYDYTVLGVLDKGLNKIKSDIELLDKDIAAIEAKLAKEKNATAQGEGIKDVAVGVAKNAGSAVSVAAVATLLIAIPVNLAIQKRNVKNEAKFKSNFTFKQPLVASDQISAEFISKYAKAIEVKSLIEAKALIESSIATADGGSIVSRASRNNMLTPANITPKNIELFKKAPINYDELMATFSEAKPFIKKLNTDSLFLVPSLSSVVRRHAESFKVITDIKVPEASGEAGSFLATGRNAHPTYLDIEVSYKDPSDLTKLGGGTNTKKSTLGFHVIPRTLKSTDILTTLKEMGDFEDMKVLNGERESQKKLSNVIKFWKKKGTNNEKAVLSSNSFSAIIDKIENVKNPLFHLMLSYGEYMDLKDNGKIDLMNRETYKKIINKMPIISISIIDEERDVVYLSEGPYMSYTKHDGSDFIDSISQYEKDLKTIIKYNQYQ